MSYRTEPVTMWFDRRIVLRKSPIHGTGTFATEAIGAGEPLIWVTGGLVYTSENWQAGHVQIDPEMYNQARLSENQLIATPKVFQYYINHSCDPNAMDQSKQPTWTHYIALRDILAQEEITADYYQYEQGELETCACMSPRCRWTKR